MKWTTGWMEREGIRSPEQREREEAAKKQDDKRYRENAKEKRKKMADAAQAGERAFSSKLNCLMEGNETRRLLETLSFGFEVAPTTEIAEGARLKAMIEKARKREKQDQRDILITAHFLGRRSRLRRRSGTAE